MIVACVPAEACIVSKSSKATTGRVAPVKGTRNPGSTAHPISRSRTKERNSACKASSSKTVSCVRSLGRRESVENVRQRAGACHFPACRRRKIILEEDDEEEELDAMLEAPPPLTHPHPQHHLLDHRCSCPKEKRAFSRAMSTRSRKTQTEAETSGRAAFAQRHRARGRA